MRALRLALDSRRGRRTWACAVVAARVRVATAKATARCCMFFLKPDIKDRSCWKTPASIRFTLVQIAGCIQTEVRARILTQYLIRTFAASHGGARHPRSEVRWRKMAVEVPANGSWASC